MLYQSFRTKKSNQVSGFKKGGLCCLVLGLNLALAGGLLADEPSESILKPINDLGYGTFSGRVQILGMYRDIENVSAGDYGHATSLGVVLNYVSPTFEGFNFGAGYDFAGKFYDGGNTNLLHNDNIHVLNEAWLRYSLESIHLKDTHIVAGRMISNGEVFRTDDFRQKVCAVEAVQLVSKDIANATFTVGHAIKRSNWLDLTSFTGYEHWNFNDFGDVFGAGYDTDGVTWAETVYTGLENWEISVFDAYAWDVANLMGTRIQYTISDDAKVTGYYRHEGDVGQAETRNSDAYGISYSQKVSGVTLEPGYFAVHGSELRFQELTTGINHPLGSSMLIYGGQFNGGAQTAYLKATTKIDHTVFYALYNYTWQDNLDFNGQELNVVVKHPITDYLTVVFKGGVGYRDWNAGSDNTTATDARIILTHTF